MKHYQAKRTPRTEADKKGMSRMLEAVRLKRIEATKPRPEEVSKNLAGVRPEPTRGF